MLVVPDEKYLQLLVQKFEWADVPVTCFREPDLDNQLTAIAVTGLAANRFLRKLPLMLRGGEGNGREHVVAASEVRCSASGE
jgi:hypothetical protein